MVPAEEDVSMERSNTHRQMEQEDMLVCFGSVHDTQIHKTNAPPGADDSQDLLDDESGITHSTTASNQKHSANEKEQESTHLVQKIAQQPALSSAVEVLYRHGRTLVCLQETPRQGGCGDAK
jgi:hypothetical protein